jgi:hypothetical protein
MDPSDSSGHHMSAILIEIGKVPTEKLFDQLEIAGRDPADWICGQLWDCADSLPSALHTELDHAADTCG